MDMLSFSINNIDFLLLDIWLKSHKAASIIRINNKNSHFPLVDLSQLTTSDSSILMTWKQYRTLAGLSRKEPKAKWFTQLEYSDGCQKEWIAIQADDIWLIGRIINKSFKSRKGVYVIDLYRKALFDHTSHCTLIKDKDTYTVIRPQNLLTMFQLNVTFLIVQGTPYWIIHSPFWLVRYDNDTFDEWLLINGDNNQPIRSRTPNHTTMDCLISIPHDQKDDDVWINRWIGPSNNKDNLIEIKDKLYCFEELSFYTDGSVQNGVPFHLRQPLDDCPDHHSMDRNLDLELIKVKAHTGDPWNELADELAKKGDRTHYPSSTDIQFWVSRPPI
ncbi:hypothetical protein RclHR1_08410018 [Rhizophagus clarus]|nr:hypothetical protein RclHR1_08410018 [Rhizophagus clarus]